MDKLKIIAVTHKHDTTAQSCRWEDQKSAEFERAWLQNPSQFDPDRCPITADQVEEAWRLITQQVGNPRGPAVEVGCGFAAISRRLFQAGCDVLATDIASNCLVHAAKLGLPTRQCTAPSTELDDDRYQLVLCCNLIAELPQRSHRHLMAELYRLCHPNGYVLISTDLDIYSKNALLCFEQLIRTELEPIAWSTQHHALLLRLEKLWPSLGTWIRMRSGLREILEKVCRRLLGDHGASHITVLARRRRAFSG
ncbi:MAG: class I SAM-dependent methyltransferase [Chlamydiia bacterium]|nr:class I SAM-dependent methyltransferase [Chlamydiia bacterium]